MGRRGMVHVMAGWCGYFTGRMRGMEGEGRQAWRKQREITSDAAEWRIRAL